MAKVTLNEIVRAARALIRDFPEFFQASFQSENLRSTYKLPQPYIDADSLIVRVEGIGDMERGEDYRVDEREGLVRFRTPLDGEAQVYIEGFHYTWFLDADLALAANFVIADHSYGREDFDLDFLTLAEATTIAMGTVVQAFWSLLSEFAMDIDVSGPEGVMIPARQRFENLMPLIQFWQDRYGERARLLGVGIDKIESYTLRRVSLTTGRLVPVYRHQEVDDRAPPTRIYLPIDSGTLPPTPIAGKATTTNRIGGGTGGGTIEQPVTFAGQYNYSTGPYVGRPPKSMVSIEDPDVTDEQQQSAFWSNLQEQAAIPEWT